MRCSYTVCSASRLLAILVPRRSIWNTINNHSGGYGYGHLKLPFFRTCCRILMRKRCKSNTLAWTTWPYWRVQWSCTFLCVFRLVPALFKTISDGNPGQDHHAGKVGRPAPDASFQDAGVKFTYSSLESLTEEQDFKLREKHALFSTTSRHLWALLFF